MRRNPVITWKRILCGAAMLSCLVAIPALGQIEVVIRPPSWFIATSRPVYYEGHAAYWYQNRWYYRDGNRWQHYDNEPSLLFGHRANDQQYRHFYGRRHGHRNGHRNRR